MTADDRLSWTDNEWEVLILHMRHHNVTPVVGSGVTLGMLPSGRQLAQEWAQAHDYPFQDRQNLARVSQYLTITRDYRYPRLLLQNVVHSRSVQTSSLRSSTLDALAELPFRLYLSTSFDDLLVRALTARDKTPRREVCAWRARRQRRSSWRLPDATVAEPLVFHLLGSLDMPDTMVLTEDDYIQYLVGISADPSAIPPMVQAAVANSSLLFIGVTPLELPSRVLFRALADYFNHAQGMGHVAVMVPPQRDSESFDHLRRQLEYLDAYFRFANFRIYWGTPQEFVAQLLARWKAVRDAD